MQRRKVQGSTFRVLFACFQFAMAALCGAQENGSETVTWRMWLEPRFMRAPVTAPIPGAEKTQYAAGEITNGELEVWSRERFQRSVGSWEEFAAKARRNASTDLAGLTPEYIRNRRKVIEYAVLRSEKPILASAVLAPDFVKMFEGTLGPKLYVVVPSRYVAIVFPALASNYRDYAPLVFREYRASAFPVSVEVFEVSAEGIKTVGAYREP